MNKKNSILIAQLESIHPQLKFLFLGVLSLTFVLVAVFWNKADISILLSWAIASCAAIILRSAFVVYSIKFVNQQNVQMHALIFAAGSLASGLIWATTSFLFLNPQDNVSLIIIVVLLLGSSAGSLVTLSSYLPAFYAYNVSILAPLAWVLLTQPNPDIAWIGILVIIFLIAMIGYSHAVNGALKKYIAMRFNNEKLLIDIRMQRDFAEKANIEKSQYLAATSHDLRQPLQALQLYLSNLERLQTTSEQHLLITKALNTSDNLNKLLRALMDVSRLDSGDVELNMSCVDLGTLVNRLAQEFQPIAEQRQIDLSILSPHFYAYTDELLLTRCLRNLICNAFDHARASKIEIIISSFDDDYVQLSIIDNGIGISHLERDNIFSEFYQLQNPERDRKKGLGLGLAIVKKLTVLLGHPLQLETSLGKGSQFSMTLKRSALLPLTDNSELNSIDLSGLFIVVVDDDPDICEAMDLTLKNWGCEIIICNSTQELIDEFGRLNYSVPDLIIADYRLQENKTGIATIQQVRQFFDSHIPAILVSGDTSESINRQIRQIDCQFQHKPISTANLKHIIHDLALPKKEFAID